MKPVYPSIALAFLVLAVLAASLLWESLNHVDALMLVSALVVGCSFFAGKSVRSYVEDMADPPPSDPRPSKSNRRRSNGSIASDPPTREDLTRLKETLGIRKGSLQFKRRGSGVYNVIYGEGRYSWQRIGSWPELKETLEILPAKRM